MENKQNKTKEESTKQVCEMNKQNKKFKTVANKGIIIILIKQTYIKHKTKKKK